MSFGGTAGSNQRKEISMATVNYDIFPVFVNGDILKEPIRGTLCVRTEKGEIKRVLPPYILNAEKHPKIWKAWEDYEEKLDRETPRGESLFKWVDEQMSIFSDLHGVDPISLYPGARSLRIFDDLEETGSFFNGKWQRVVYHALTEGAMLNNLHLFRKYAYDSRVSRDVLVDLALTKPVFIDRLGELCKPPYLSVEKKIDFSGEELWQARRNVNRALDALLKDGTVVTRKDGLLELAVMYASSGSIDAEFLWWERKHPAIFVFIGDRAVEVTDLT